MTGMREHIQHRDPFQMVARRQQCLAVASKRCGITRNIDHALWRKFNHMRHHARGPGARRIEQYLVKSLRSPRLARNVFLQVVLEKADIFKIIQLRILRCLPH